MKLEYPRVMLKNTTEKSKYQNNQEWLQSDWCEEGDFTKLDSEKFPISETYLQENGANHKSLLSNFPLLAMQTSPWQSSLEMEHPEKLETRT